MGPGADQLTVDGNGALSHDRIFDLTGNAGWTISGLTLTHGGFVGGTGPAAGGAIFVNRNLRMTGIAWVGFDMDYTLAVYRQQEMDDLSIKATIEKLNDAWTAAFNKGDARHQLEAAETRVEMLIRKDGKMTAEPFRPEKS